MKIFKCDLWELYDAGYTICIPTNGFTKNNGEAVMGAGIAKDFKDRFPKFPKEFGSILKTVGNHVYYFSNYRALTFPTKHKWMYNSDVELIDRSCQELKLYHEQGSGRYKDDLVFLPFPGVGNGKLKKEDVLPVLEKHFEDYKKIVVVDKE